MCYSTSEPRALVQECLPMRVALASMALERSMWANTPEDAFRFSIRAESLLHNGVSVIERRSFAVLPSIAKVLFTPLTVDESFVMQRSEERRVGKECRSRGGAGV